MIKSLHILGVILFLGNIIVSALWRLSAEKSKDILLIRHALKLINITDLIFTLPGAILIAFTGHMMASNFGGIGGHPWIYHSYALLTVSALIWLAGLLPLQRKQTKLLQEEGTDTHLSQKFTRLTKWWSILGLVATILPLIALILMVVRPD